MAKDPAFPFYAQDYLVDTLRWSRAMKGLHVDLMAESWANGQLKNDGGYPEGLSAEDRQLWLKISYKWILTDSECWVNSKLEEVRAARKKFIKKQSEKGKISADKKKKSTTVNTESQPKVNSGSTVVEPIESEYEKENEKVLKNNETESIEEILKWGIGELYLDQEKIKWPHLDFDFEVNTFKNKVRGSPNDYITRDTDGIRKAFQYQLRNAKKKNGTGHSKDRRQDNLNSLIEDFAIRHHQANSEG